MSYASQLAADQRTPVSLLRITLDSCDRTFGTSPCLASGSKCYNTRHTCVYTTAYLNTTGKVHRFTSNDAPLPFKDGERPYLLAVRPMPTEIDETRTITSRVQVQLLDEPDTDVGVDPYVSSRSSVQGTFWQKLLARNPNYKGRQVELLEGFTGEPEANFATKFVGFIERIYLRRGRVTLEVVDRIKDLTTIFWPPKLGLRLRLALADTDVVVNLEQHDDFAALPASGHILVNDEVIAYSSKSSTAYSLAVSARGEWGTVAADHDLGDRVGRAIYYSPRTAKNMLGQVMTDNGLVANVDYDLTALTAIGANLFPTPLLEGKLAKPERLDVLLFELAWHADSYMWVGEALKLTFTRKLPNQSGRIYHTLTDGANFVLHSISGDMKDEDRRTRVELYWNRDVLAEDNETPEDFRRLAVAWNAESESADLYDGQQIETVFSRWLYTTAESDLDAYVRKVNRFAVRQQMRLNEAPIEIEGQVELKDQDVHTGSWCMVSTDRLTDIHGNPLTNQRFVVIRREVIGNKIQLRLRRTSLRKFCIIAPSSYSSKTWATATEAERDYGAIANAAPNYGKMDQNGNDGYILA